MFSARSWFRSLAVILPFLLWSSALGVDFDEEDPPAVTGRVARISYISDDAQVRRAGSQDWEKVTLNLPLVEGDPGAPQAAGRDVFMFMINGAKERAPAAAMEVIARVGGAPAS